MPETELTKNLKKVGTLFLKNNLCHIIAPEVWVWNYGFLDESNFHRIIDLVGIGIKYNKVGDHPKYLGGIYEKIQILRGIEIKISRSDFKHGFIQRGCNYHYLLTPKGLIDKSEVQTKIGIIEYDPKKFSVKKVQGKYWFKGLEVIRRPQFQKITKSMFDYVSSQIAKASTDELLRMCHNSLKTK